MLPSIIITSEIANGLVSNFFLFIFRRAGGGRATVHKSTATSPKHIYSEFQDIILLLLLKFILGFLISEFIV